MVRFIRLPYFNNPDFFVIYVFNIELPIRLVCSDEPQSIWPRISPKPHEVVKPHTITSIHLETR